MTTLNPPQEVWVAGASGAWMLEALGRFHRVHHHELASELLSGLRRKPPDVLVFVGLADLGVDALLEELSCLGEAAPFLLLANDAEPSPGAGSEDAPGYYRLLPGTGAPELCRCVNAILRARHGHHERGPMALELSLQVAGAARRVSLQTSAEGVGRAIEAAATSLLDAARARCLFFDPRGCVSWRESATGEEAFAPARGVAGWAATAADLVNLAAAAADPRYRPEVDDPAGRGDERLLAVPIVDGQHQCHATLIAIRAPAHPVFSVADQALARELASALAPQLQRLAFEARAEQRRRSELAITLGGPDLFRQEALDAYAATGERGQVIRVYPRWVDNIFWALLGVTATFVLLVSIARVPEYSEGPAVVWMGADVEVTAGVSGRLGSVLVAPGQAVRRGDALMHLFTEDELVELDRAEREWASALRAYLTDPDTARAQLLLGAQSARNGARAGIARRIVYAPHDGIASEARVRMGQSLSAGQVLMAIIPQSSRPSVVAALPGKDRARLKSGERLRLELEGHQQTYLDLTVTSVADDVLGVSEARRFFGGAGDTMNLPGAVTLVSAPLLETTFENRKQIFEFSHGMIARASVTVGSQTLIEMLFPSWEEL